MLACLSLLTQAQTVIPSYVPTNSLVVWYPFNGNANDESGNSNHGAVNGASLTADRFGNANKTYSFDGVDDIITINNSTSFNFSNGQAISFWIYINSFPITGESIIFSQQTSSSTSAIGFNVTLASSGKLNYRIGNGSVTTFAGVLNNTVNLNQWYHVICQFQNGQLSVFLNSLLSNSTNQPNAVVGYPNISMIIGDDTWGGLNASNYSGKLDDIGIWSRALTDCEIKKLYYAPSFTASASSANICAGQSLTLTAGGVPNYAWSNGAITASTIVTPSATTIYTVTSTYTTGCTDTKSVSVTVNAKPIISINSPSICVGQSATLTASGATTYTWNTNSNSASIVVSPSVTTNYTVNGTNTNGCSNTKSITVTVNACTGINEAQLPNELSVYPNPTKDNITVVSNSNFIGKTYSITDQLGKLITNGKLTSENVKISLSSFPNGLYFVKIEGQTFKIVKE